MDDHHVKKIKPKRRSRRRADIKRIKAKVRRYDVAGGGPFNPWPAQPPEEPDARRVGMVAATHRACSCSLCKFERYDRLAAKREAQFEQRDNAWYD